jgi:hypothetical protein
MEANLQWRKVFQLLDFVIGAFVDELIGRKVPAMDDSMACIGNVLFVVHLFQVLVTEEGVEDMPEGVAV